MSILIYGPSGQGKSRRFLQLSKYYPADDEKPHTGPLVVADDVFVVSYDKGGMISGLPLGLDVPHVPVHDMLYELGSDVIDRDGNKVRKRLGLREFHKRYLFPMMSEAYNAGTRLFCLDTITMMMAMVQPELQTAYTDEKGNLDGMRYWPALNTFAYETFMAATSLPGAQVVFLGHSKYKEDIVVANKREGETPEQAKAKLEMKKEVIDPYLSKITLDMPGKSAEPFMNISSLVLALELSLNPRTQKYERNFIVHPGETEHRAKNRLDHWLSPKEPGNLRKVVDKVKARAGIGAATEK
jgi:hypothetical protein